MSSDEPIHPKLSDRDKLELIQKQLREVRTRTAALRQEKAELLSQTAALEQEVRELRQVQEDKLLQLPEHAPRGLPERFRSLVFQASPSLRTGYARWRTALKLLPGSLGLCVPIVFTFLLEPKTFLPGAGAIIVSLLMLLRFFPVPEDAEAFPHWSFDSEGFYPADKGAQGGKILYKEIDDVDVSQGPLQRAAGVGTVTVTWTPEAPTALGSPAGFPQRIVKLRLIEAPENLATWLLQRADADDDAEGAAHVD